MTSKERFKRAVHWIALNDEPTDMDADDISGYVSTLLIADTFEKDPLDVADAILLIRRQMKAKGEL